MHNGERKCMPPLRIWALFSIMMFVGATLLYGAWTYIKEIEFASRMQYVQEKNATSDGKPLILFLGTSLTQCALDSTSVLEKEIWRKTGVNPVVAKVWRSATTPQMFLSGMPGLEKIRPAILVVEANMLCYTTRQKYFFEEIPETLYKLRMLQLRKPYAPEKKAPEKQDDRPMAKRTLIADTSSLATLRDLVSQLHQSGTQIMFVNIPMEASEEMIKWSSTDTALFTRNFNYIREKVPFSYYDPKASWGMAYYRDRGHLNQKGCKAFSKWMVEHLAFELKQR